MASYGWGDGKGIPIGVTVSGANRHDSKLVKATGEEAKALREQIGFRVHRWVVERTHSWMNRFRRILVRWEKHCENYLAMLHIVHFKKTALQEREYIPRRSFGFLDILWGFDCVNAFNS